MLGSLVKSRSTGQSQLGKWIDVKSAEFAIAVYNGGGSDVEQLEADDCKLQRCRFAGRGDFAETVEC